MSEDLPAAYAGGRRHPVVYMQDGQNLSDPSTAFAGTWQLDAVLGALAEAVLVFDGRGDLQLANSAAGTPVAGAG